MSLIHIALQAAKSAAESPDDLIRKTVSRIAIEKLANSAPPRPHPFSLRSAVPKSPPETTSRGRSTTTPPGPA